MSKQLVNDKNDVVIGIATPAAQDSGSYQNIPVIMGLSQTLLGQIG
ncbi:MAG: ABC transporter substrate binding protein [Streptococcus salivarius]